MRRTLTLLVSVLTGALIAALVVVAVPAEGAPNGGGPGDPLLLSRVNQAGPMTVLKTNGGFRILAKNPARPPLMIYSPDSMPPLDVSSTAKVANLNVDLLDGESAADLASVSGGCGRTNWLAGNPTEWSCDITLTTSTAGAITMNGSAYMQLQIPIADDTVECGFFIGAAPTNWARWSWRRITLPADGPFSPGICATNTWVEVPAGTHHITFMVKDIGPNTQLADVGANAIFTPGT